MKLPDITPSESGLNVAVKWFVRSTSPFGVGTECTANAFASTPPQVSGSM